MSSKPNVQAFRWTGTALLVLEQRDLPHKTRYVTCRTHKQVADCIRHMSVRGAPAIGCTAAYGIALACREKKFKTWADMKVYLEKASDALARTRPTAVNLFWALKRMKDKWESLSSEGKSFQRGVIQALTQEARAIDEEDLAGCIRMGEFGADLFPENSIVLTHCNAGALATAGHGTALGVIRSAHARGKIRKVLVDETRPYLQGARLTAWECDVEKIPYEVVTDNMAAHLMKTEKISAVIVGADRIAANGDTANKIGTYALAILARHHGIPFYVAAPFSTIDLNTPSGDQIPIEERSSKEVLWVGKKLLTPKNARARHPAFDVTPHDLITAIVTERGVIRPPYRENIRGLPGAR
jgi:methylthioribose-1-phosphate isomerase